MSEQIKEAIEPIEQIIAVCDESIESDRLEGFPRESIGRSDTFMIRNTLSSILAILRPLAEEPPQGEFTKNIRDQRDVWDNMPNDGVATWLAGKLSEACVIIDRQAAELKAKDEKFDILANHVIDMSHAIIGWREAVAFDSEDDLIGELERMVGEALKLVPKF